MAEHYVLLHQYAKQWVAEDNEMDKQLAELRKQNGGKRLSVLPKKMLKYRYRERESDEN